MTTPAKRRPDLTPEERAAALRNLTRGMWALALAGVVAVVFGVIANKTSLGSAEVLAKVNFNVLIFGGVLALMMAGGVYFMLRAIKSRER